MKAKISLLSVLAVFIFLSCASRGQEEKSYEVERSSSISIELSNVGFIRVHNEGNEYEIRDREKLKNTLAILNKSSVKYVKFGSKNTFKVYDANQNIIIDGLFKDDVFKIKGVVYQADQILFE